ncbi:calcium/sodium antiporter [Phenylobacterium sp.]|uniref:calcium/sodium antiporter n=1 Tax=Phenylobacterium sp. TaxID=1871053 RepID=UPI0025EA195E|nr:calcium/sodium antiporter [Phenylobacterium sp.]
MMTTLLILGGLVLLAGGGEVLVRGAVGAARAVGVSPLLSGLVLVGFGTSTPELVTSLLAALRDSPGIAVGNVLGSNIANILLILGVTAAISPVMIRPSVIRRDMIALGLSSVLLLAAVIAGFVDFYFGLVLILALMGYIGLAYVRERNRAGEAGAVKARDWTGFGKNLLLTVGGIALTVFGARLLVDGAVELAEGLGVSETVIGLTVVAVGTSLPELVACVVAALRRHSEVAVGNVIGSNVYNALGILGVTAMVSPIRIPPEVIRLDIWVLLGATALLAVFLRTGGGLKRLEGAAFLAAYAAYVGFLATGGV